MNASILDRLLDIDNDPGRGPVQYQRLSFSQARESVGRDLENLLNTKCFAGELPEHCRELGRSVYRYGLPDFTSKNPGSPAVRGELRQEIERALELFEPRLKKVSVQLEQADRSDRRLKFRISALLVMDDDSEPVRFDTFFDINKGEYQVPR